MSKKIALLGLGTIVACLLIVPVAFSDGPSGIAGISNFGHLYLYQKNPDGWLVVPGAWGKLKYNRSGPTFNFVFNGHDLEPNTPYTLIYYPDKNGNPWPRVDVICLAEGTSNNGGDLNLRDSFATGPLPDTGVDVNTGAKIWLVLSSAVDCTDPLDAIMSGWEPTRYLFEFNTSLVYVP
jgi:hypothetical protein